MSTRGDTRQAAGDQRDGAPEWPGWPAGLAGWEERDVTSANDSASARPARRGCSAAPATHTDLREGNARTHHARARRAPQLRQGGAGDPRARGAGAPAAGRAHRPALRRAPVRGVLRPARPARAGREPGRRLGQPRPADGGGADRARAGLHGLPAGPGRGLRRRELQRGRRAGGRQAADTHRPRRGRPAQFRRDDAGGDQPPAHRPDIQPAVRDLSRGGGLPGQRGPAG